MKAFLVGLLLFLVCFGPKFGFLDTSLLASIILLTVTCFFKKYLTVNKQFLSVLAIMTIISAYSIVVYFSSGFADSYVVLRALRSTITTLCIGIFILNSNFREKSIINYLLIFLSINSAVVLLQIIFPQLQVHMASITGFDKKFSPIRAFGLTPGYDSAGYLCVVGLIFVIFRIVTEGIKGKNIILIYYFVVSGFFTGRSVMIIMVFVLVALNIFLLFKGKLIFKAFSMVNFFVGGVIVYNFVLPILMTTLPFLMSHSISSTVIDTGNLKDSFASSSGDQLADMFFLPPDPISSILGTGINPHDSDVGYIKLIHMIGFVGLAFTIALYVYILANCRFNKKASSDQKDRLILERSLFIITIFLFLFNLKTLYFMSRNFHEVIIIAFFANSKKHVVAKRKWNFQ